MEISARVWDYERGCYDEDFSPRSSVGLQPGSDWMPWLNDAASSNAWNAENGWSFEVRDEKTGKMRMTNNRERAAERQQQQRDDELRNAWGW